MFRPRITFVTHVLHLSNTHLTGISQPFPERLGPQLLIEATSGGLKPSPARRFRGTSPHLQYSTTTFFYSLRSLW